MRLYHSGLASWIWTWAPLGRPVEALPQSAALGSPDFLTDLCGRSQPVGPPRLSRDAHVGCVCHCHCSGDRRNRHLVRLAWGNGSFGCRTIAARTRYLILVTIPAITMTYTPVLAPTESFEALTYRFVGILRLFGVPNPSLEVRDTPPPPPAEIGLGTRCDAWVLSRPPHGLL